MTDYTSTKIKNMSLILEMLQ